MTIELYFTLLKMSCKTNAISETRREGPGAMARWAARERHMRATPAGGLILSGCSPRPAARRA